MQANSTISKAVDTARILNEALPYIQRYSGKTVVIKYGGNAMVDEDLKRAFAQNIVMLRQVGVNPVVVHGGGPQIGQMLDRLSITSTFIDGLRVTDSDTMDVVEMVLGGQVNKQIVSLMNQAGGRAIGLTGKDSMLIEASPLQLEGRPENALGYVGEVRRIRREVIDALIANGNIPVIAPIGTDANGASFNINADLVASSVAKALNATRLLLLTNTEGILDADGKLVRSLTPGDIERLKTEGVLSGGMLPKVDCALDALTGGVQSVVIIDGRVKHAVLLELFTDQGAGSLIQLSQ